MQADLLVVAGGAAVGAAGAVWAVFRVMLSGVTRDILEAKASVLDAHQRINRHVEVYHK